MDFGGFYSQQKLLFIQTNPTDHKGIIHTNCHPLCTQHVHCAWQVTTNFDLLQEAYIGLKAPKKFVSVIELLQKLL